MNPDFSSPRGGGGESVPNLPYQSGYAVASKRMSADRSLKHRQGFEKRIMDKRRFDDFSVDGYPIDLGGETRKKAAVFEPSIQFSAEREIVCFGMVTGITGYCYMTTSGLSIRSHPIRFADPECFVGLDSSDFNGKVSPDHTHVMDGIMGEDALELEANSTIVEESAKCIARNKSYRMPGFPVQCTMEIILYGPMEIFEDIGAFFQEYDICLRDPVNCKRNVPYCNPHWFSVAPSIPRFTFDLKTEVTKPPLVVDVDTHPELLDILNSQEDLVETEQPRSIRTKLAKHQKQALTFMLQREDGWAWDGSRPDVWEVGTLGGQEHYDLSNLKYSFHNRVSDACQKIEPPQFYGGIVADPMGLVLATWEEQLRQHSFDNSIPWCLHHGKSRLVDSTSLKNTLVVLTTYHTVMRDWANGNGAEGSGLFKTRWKRIILDEAHSIRNSESQMARAICSLDSVARWAVTGTPIQNKLGDLYTLLKFLKVYPYMDKKVFDDDISYLWKSGNDEEAVRRLKRLASCLLLRRPKDILELPPKRDLQYLAEFTAAERSLYDDIKNQAIAQIDEALDYSGDLWRSNSFVNVLQKIEAMRMVCDLGLHYSFRHDTRQSKSQHSEDWLTMAQRVFDLRREFGQVQCKTCTNTLDILEETNDACGVLDVEDDLERRGGGTATVFYTMPSV
ncbi:hypothetical protein FZEAL_88 [Fusarium zealandicum]|uniref:Helicase ATP-binding domain-containing protein n=1 Tax=Fusarium zealandicum TaxID=1053134 RepID=A0A8H4XQN6_9HYPO|nr:hypothetical protein FZEAL_88 [Fusarium zealandicum]